MDNEWLDAKDMENTQELIAEFHNSNLEFHSHIRMALEHLHDLHPLFPTLPSTLTPTYMSDALHTESTIRVEENATPLPIPPRLVTSNAPEGPVRTQEQDTTIQERITEFLRICKDGLLRHGRDVHPMWVKSSIETLSNTRVWGSVVQGQSLKRTLTVTDEKWLTA